MSARGSWFCAAAFPDAHFVPYSSAKSASVGTTGKISN